MRVYEARIQYNLVSLGEDVVLDTPAKVTEYLKDLYEANPVQEQFVVIMVDRKKPPDCPAGGYHRHSHRQPGGSQGDIQSRNPGQCGFHHSKPQPSKWLARSQARPIARSHAN